MSIVDHCNQGKLGKQIMNCVQS